LEKRGLEGEKRTKGPRDRTIPIFREGKGENGTENP